MSKETEHPHAKKHHKHNHKHHTVKPHPHGEGHGHQVHNAAGHLIGHFADEEAAHEFVENLEGPQADAEEPKAE